MQVSTSSAHSFPSFLGVPWSGHPVNHQCTKGRGLSFPCLIVNDVRVYPGWSICAQRSRCKLQGVGTAPLLPFCRSPVLAALNGATRRAQLAMNARPAYALEPNRFNVCNDEVCDGHRSPCGWPVPMAFGLPLCVCVCVCACCDVCVRARGTQPKNATQHKERGYPGVCGMRTPLDKFAAVA